MSIVMFKRVLGRGAGLVAIAGLSLMCSCSFSTLSNDGGGSRGGNPVVVGTIAGPDGDGERNVRVCLIAEDYNPLTDAPLRPSSADTTDSLGSFKIVAPDSGGFNVEAVGILGGERSIRFNVKALRDSILVLPVDTLRRPGAIKVPRPDGSDAADGYMYVPGTSIAVWLAGAGDTVAIDSVPAGTLPVLYYAQRSGIGKKAIRYAIPVRSDETTLIRNPEWSYSRQVYLNTSSSGASVSGDVYNFPVLIRLNFGNFDFTQARNDGADCMVAGSGNAALPFEIERWDASIGRAEIWVKIDTVFGNDSDQSITLYWGNSASSLPPVKGRVFDTVGGYQGVWHMGDAAGDLVRDATKNQYDGTSPATARPQIAEGRIGKCRTFDGNRAYITMPNTAASKLNFPQNGSYTVSAWVLIDTFDTTPHVIVSKGYEQYFLRSTYFPSKSWEFVEFDENTNWQSSRSEGNNSQWTLLTGIRQGSRQFLYCNGMLVDSAKDVWPNQGSLRNTSNDLSIGSFLKEVTIPENNGYCFFKGSIDEVRILSVAQSPDWVRLCYMNQRADNRLIVFKK